MSSLNHFIGVYQYACWSSCDTSSNTGTNNNGEFPSCEPRGVNGRSSKLTLFSFSSAACDATGLRETGVSQFLLLQIYFNSPFLRHRFVINKQANCCRVHETIIFSKDEKICYRFSTSKKNISCSHTTKCCNKEP